MKVGESTGSQRVAQKTRFEKVLVTGGAGLIGSHIVDLLAEGHNAGTFGEIVVLDNFVRGVEDNVANARRVAPVSLIDGDIRDPSLVQQAMDGVDLVFHLAAIRITQCAEDPRLAMEVLGDGTFNVVDAAARAGVKRVVASSSASVYGLADRFPTKETHHPYNNRTLYGALKVFNEGLLRSYHEMYGLDYIALRYFNVYGPRMDKYGAYTEVLIRWMERLEVGDAPVIFGDGKQTMDFIYATDIARANVLAALSEITDEVFNIASGTETSLEQLAHRLAAAMDRDLRVQWGPERAVNPVPRRLADTARARDMLGFEATVGIDQGLQQLVQWWRSGRDGTASATS